MRKFFFFALISIMLYGCTDNSGEEIIDSKKVKGYVNIYYNNNKIELKDLDVSSFRYIDNDLSENMSEINGITFCAFINDKHSVSMNSLFLDISTNFELAGVTFNNSEENTNYSTSYKNYYKKYNDELTPFRYELFQEKNIIKGKFSGILYSGVDFITIDSCVFYIENSSRL